jgi:hypothetical protein
MQSVHAHPPNDCLHFCMNSAAVNIYIYIIYKYIIYIIYIPGYFVE